MVDGAWDGTIAFHDRRRGKARSCIVNTPRMRQITISNDEEDDCKLAKRPRFHPLSPTTFTGWICVKLEVFMVEETNEHRVKEE